MATADVRIEELVEFDEATLAGLLRTSSDSPGSEVVPDLSSVTKLRRIGEPTLALHYKETVPAHWRVQLRWDDLHDDLKEQIGRFGLAMYGLGQHVTSEVQGIKYDGRLVVLEDGTRWEVDPADTSTCEFWQPCSKVVIIDGEMYNIEDTEKVAVQEQS